MGVPASAGSQQDMMKAGAEVNQEKDAPSFKQQNQSDTTELKAFTAKTRPTLESHLAMRQGLQKKMMIME